jgi:hypothetical protein
MTKANIEKMQADAEKALKKAVKKALARHAAAGVPAVVWRNGKVVELPIRRAKRKRKR